MKVKLVKWNPKTRRMEVVEVETKRDPAEWEDMEQ